MGLFHNNAYARKVNHSGIGLILLGIGVKKLAVSKTGRRIEAHEVEKITSHVLSKLEDGKYLKGLKHEMNDGTHITDKELQNRFRNELERQRTESTAERRLKLGFQKINPKAFNVTRKEFWTGERGKSTLRTDNLKGTPYEDVSTHYPNGIDYENHYPDFKNENTFYGKIEGLIGSHSHDMPEIERRFASLFNSTQQKINSLFKKESVTAHHTSEGTIIQNVDTLSHKFARHAGGVSNSTKP